MTMQGIPTCSHPTTVLFVDDSKDFLLNFSLHFDYELSYRIFASPKEALVFANQQTIHHPLQQRCFSEYPDGLRGSPNTSHSMHLDISSIHKEIYNPDRFKHITVCVVDYAMPEMNGIEFCKQLQLRDENIKCILLTGQADEKTAIDAFNDGIIQQFIMKNDPDVINKVLRGIRDLQLFYFRQMSQMIIQALSIETPSFLMDHIFTNFFHNTCKEYHIVEYYLTESPGSFLLMDKTGKSMWLIVKNKADLQMHYELARDHNAPHEVLRDLEIGYRIPHFGTARIDYGDSDESHDHWQNHLYLAETIEGNDTYYYAIIEHDDKAEINKSQILTFEKFLNQESATIN